MCYYNTIIKRLMTYNEIFWWARGYIDGLIAQGRPEDELPSINEVILNADHIILVDDGKENDV